MSVRFVATEILSSADGLSHGETQVLETDEVRAARAAGGGGGKTLYEQLEAEREKQQEAYDANTKALFSPGEVLDAEDVAVEAGGALWLRKREHLPADRRLINLDRHSLPVADGELTLDERDLLLCLIRDERPPDRLRTRAALTAAKR